MSKPRHLVMFDVGANIGQNSIEQTRNNPNLITYAFEPVPELYEAIVEATKDIAARYHVYPIALSNYIGKAIFNISDHDDGTNMGCSSLNTFREDLHEDWQKVPIVFEANRQIEVEVNTFEEWYLDTFSLNVDHPEKWEGLGLYKIDFFHCDTQGSDLDVLEGMGPYFHMIREGVIECAKDETVTLYEGAHTLGQAVDFLTRRGYSIVSVTPNDLYGNEYNLHFRRS